MKLKLLKILCCPNCQKDFSWKSFKEQDGEIIDGILFCDCGTVFPVINFIPRIFFNALKENKVFAGKYFNLLKGYLGKNNENFSEVKKERKNKESFEFEWLNYNLEMGNEKDIFLEETQIPAGLWPGKLVLDVGCGMGRFTKIPLQLGAKVVAMDLGLGVENAFKHLQSLPNCHIVQADLMFPPFKKKTFEIVYSLGVLHHTRDTKTAFSKISQLVKEGGFASIWVYGRAGRYKDFITNPLRANRERLGKILYQFPFNGVFWLMVKTRETVSNFLRLFTTRMPVKLLYYFCYLLSFLGKAPIIKYFTFSVLPDWKARVWENFDWLSPVFQQHHTKEEVIAWFKEEGFSELTVLPHGLIPKPGVRGKKKNSLTK
ncbi:MAG: methyltransferase domain-containing protein [Elusimicrobiota bacterium]